MASIIRWGSIRRVGSIGGIGIGGGCIGSRVIFKSSMNVWRSRKIRVRIHITDMIYHSYDISHQRVNWRIRHLLKLIKFTIDPISGRLMTRHLQPVCFLEYYYALKSRRNPFYSPKIVPGGVSWSFRSMNILILDHDHESYSMTHTPVSEQSIKRTSRRDFIHGLLP